MGRLLLIAAVLVLATACDDSLSAEQVAELSSTVDISLADATAREEARVAAVQAFMASPTGGSTPTTCAEGVWMDADPLDDSRNQRDVNFAVVQRAELAEERGTRMEAASLHARSAQRGIDPTNAMTPTRGEDYASELEDVRTFGDAEWWLHEVSFVVTDQLAPRRAGPGTFTPGHLVGTVVVWSYADGSVVCAFPHRVENASTEEVSAPTADGLLRGLRSRAQNQIRGILRGQEP